MMLSHGTTCQALLPLSVFVIGIMLIHVHKRDRNKYWFQHENGRLSEVTMNTIALLVWPCVFGATVGWEFVRKYPIVLIGFGWTIVMMVWDMYSSLNEEETAALAEAKNSNTKMNANVIIGAGWAVGSLLAVVSKTNALSPKSAKVLLISLVLCVAFVVPMMIETDLQKPMSRGMRSIQRNVLQYAIGLFVSGVVINWVM